MHKPVIYTPFDKDSFFEGQAHNQSYWDYETMGLGPVCYDYKDVDEQEMDDFLIAHAINHASYKIFLLYMKYGQQFSEELHEW